MAVGRRVLGEVGVGADAEDVYRVLLTDPGLSTSELSERVEFGRPRLRSALADLERLAIITRLSGTPVRFQPAPPDVVVEALVSSREEAMRRTRLEARELLTLRRHPDQVKVTEIVEVLTSREGLGQRWAQVLASTARSLEVLVRPPFAQNQLEDNEGLQLDLLTRGVAIRAVYDQEALEFPGVFEHVQRMVAAGEQARVVTELPLKVALSDRQVALVPLIQEDPDRTTDAGLTVRRSTMLDALTSLFDVFWERGVDVKPRDVPEDSPEAPEGDVLALMSAGLKDEAIAAQLGVSVQTIRRRIRAVEKRLGVTSRFQAGLALGRRPAARTEDRADPRRRDVITSRQ